MEKKSLIKQNLFSVTFPCEDRRWACGRWGMVLHTADGGKSWGQQKSGTDYTLISIFFIDTQMSVSMLYSPALRRIRKMGTTDTQDPNGGMTYDDTNCLSQKITPKKYLYEFAVEEREYLLPFAYNMAKAWVDSKTGYALRNAQFMCKF